jgi:GT2 family glycosyltransferase
MAPTFSVITPVYETPAALLTACIDSVRNQTLDDWELILIDDGSVAPHLPAMLDAAARDPRITVIRRAENGGIVAASNDGIAAARGELIALLDHDDELHPEALEAALHAIDGAGRDEVDYLYTDSDMILEDGTHRDPFFKPDWSPERFRAQMYTNHLGILRRSLVLEVGGFRAGFDGSQDFDLVFRVTEKARRVVHVPRVLYHWRVVATSVAGDPDAKPYAWLAGRKAIESHIERTGFEATVGDDIPIPGVYRLRPALREHPTVSIVIPTAGTVKEVHGEPTLLAERCVASVIERSTYDNYEIVAVIDHHTDPEARRRILAAGGDRIRAVTYTKPFSFSDKCNVGAVRSDGEHVLLLNDDIEVISPDWLEAMLMYSRLPAVGAVGARLLFGDGRLQHVGIGMSDGAAPGQICRGWNAEQDGYYGIFRLPCNWMAVTGACLMSRRDVYVEVGGLSTDFPNNFNDVDYCYKVHERGYRVVYTPEAELFHHESASRDPVVAPHELDRLRDRWQILERDPYLNPNFGNRVHPFNPPNDRHGNIYSQL